MSNNFGWKRKIGKKVGRGTGLFEEGRRLL
jgi:hypothetical protein